MALKKRKNILTFLLTTQFFIAGILPNQIFGYFPDTPYDLVWERQELGSYTISWQGSSHKDTSYLVFASNDPDHMETLLANTKETSLTVDGRFSYYQITALHQEIPSELSERLHLNLTFDPLNFSKKTSKASIDYVKSKYVDDEIWHAVYPYLLPTNHPLKPKLDQIFCSGRVTATVDNMKEAGFVLCKKLGLHVVAAKHPLLKGVVVKAYVDHLSKETEWKKWITRIQAANAIRSAIALHGYKSIFKVPKKWIYPLPDNSSPPDSPDYQRKHFVLIAEDMNILDHPENKKRYKYSLKRSDMEALYVLCEELGLADSARIHNLPWTKDHHLAFVDTEAFQRWPVKYHPFLEYLSQQNRQVWLGIIANQRQE